MAASLRRRNQPGFAAGMGAASVKNGGSPRNRPADDPAECFADVWAEFVAVLKVRGFQRRGFGQIEDRKIGVASDGDSPLVMQIESAGAVLRDEARDFCWR